MRFRLHSRNLLACCLACFLICGLLAACAPVQTPDFDPAAEAALIAERPYETATPESYEGQPTPLVLLLHAYKTSGLLQELFFGFTPLVDSAGFLLAYPDGTANHQGELFWNATDGCCNLDGSSVDDVAYLRAVIHDMKRRYNVDSRRVFVIGHSNGAFMSHRLACDLSSEIAGIVSVAGAVWNDAARCRPESPVAVLQVHGDLDDVVRYGGGGASPPLTGPYPSARETVAQWATHNGCGALRDTTQPIDIVSDLSGAETRVERYEGCRTAAVELWTMQGGGHYPLLLPAFGTTLWTFLQAHAKPMPAPVENPEN